MLKFSWTPETEARLRELWAQGLSTSKVAAELGGVSRNAVLGKLHRLGIAERVKPKKEKAARAPKAPGTYLGPNNARKVVRNAPQPQPVISHAVPSIPISERVALVDLKFDQCRWPEGDPYESDFGFCGRPRKNPFNELDQYCAAHAAVARAPRAASAKR